MNKLKLMTIIGTRPEIIRLSAVIKKCDKYFDQILVHTGQNYDYNLNQVFLGIWACARRTSIWMPWARTWAKPSAISSQNPMP